MVRSCDAFIQTSDITVTEFLFFSCNLLLAINVNPIFVCHNQTCASINISSAWHQMFKESFFKIHPFVFGELCDRTETNSFVKNITQNVNILKFMSLNDNILLKDYLQTNVSQLILWVLILTSMLWSPFFFRYKFTISPLIIKRAKIVCIYVGIHICSREPL